MPITSSPKSCYNEKVFPLWSFYRIIILAEKKNNILLFTQREEMDIYSFAKSLMDWKNSGQVDPMMTRSIPKEYPATAHQQKLKLIEDDEDFLRIRNKDHMAWCLQGWMNYIINPTTFNLRATSWSKKYIKIWNIEWRNKWVYHKQLAGKKKRSM